MGDLQTAWLEPILQKYATYNILFLTEVIDLIGPIITSEAEGRASFHW